MKKSSRKIILTTIARSVIFLAIIIPVVIISGAIINGCFKDVLDEYFIPFWLALPYEVRLYSKFSIFCAMLAILTSIRGYLILKNKRKIANIGFIILIGLISVLLIIMKIRSNVETYTSCLCFNVGLMLIALNVIIVIFSKLK